MRNLLKPAQAVIFSSDMEPIVSIDMRQWYWDLLYERGNIVFSVSPPLSASFITNIDPIDTVSVLYVRVNAIPFDIRGSIGLMLMTDDDINALLLKSSWLPGQVKDLNEERKKAFAQGFLRAMFDMRDR
jgi:hypothetical protein